jgi:hypothetical protein
VTPKNYLDLIANYRSQLKSNDKKIEQSVKRLDGGTYVCPVATYRDGSWLTRAIDTYNGGVLT